MEKLEWQRSQEAIDKFKAEAQAGDHDLSFPDLWFRHYDEDGNVHTRAVFIEGDCTLEQLKRIIAALEKLNSITTTGGE